MGGAKQLPLLLEPLYAMCAAAVSHDLMRSTLQLSFKPQSSPVVAGFHLHAVIGENLAKLST